MCCEAVSLILLTPTIESHARSYLREREIRRYTYAQRRRGATSKQQTNEIIQHRGQLRRKNSKQQTNWMILHWGQRRIHLTGASGTGAGRFCLSFFLYSLSAGTTCSCTWNLRLSNLLLRPKCAFSSLPLWKRQVHNPLPNCNECGTGLCFLRAAESLDICGFNFPRASEKGRTLGYLCLLAACRLSS